MDCWEQVRVYDTRRIIYWGSSDPVWYLGERVMTQHSHPTSLVPIDPPPSMYETKDIIAYVETEEVSIGYERLVQQGVDYRTALLLRLVRVLVLEAFIYHSM